MASPEKLASDIHNTSDGSSTAGSADNGFALPLKKLTVTFENVGIEVAGMGQSWGSDCLSVVQDLCTFGRGKAATRHILQGISGQVCPGEMMLVLGRPGSGCTSLLKILSNHRDEFYKVMGDVHFGSMSAKEARPYRHEIVMNTEDDIHFPTLKVSETIGFSTSTKLPASRPAHLADAGAYNEATTATTLAALGIAHTAGTLVGNEMVRGVSGGERKRVSLGEVLAARAPVSCWDNATRGLDASSALDFGKVLRASADNPTRPSTVVVTLYQASNALFALFDKVLVLVGDGRCAYYGPGGAAARAYFEDMGFVCPPGASVADFLTAVAVPTEREVRAGFEGSVPTTPEEFEKVYKKSDLARRMRDAAAARPCKTLEREAADLRRVGAADKVRTVKGLSRRETPYLASFRAQVWACAKRQFQILWGDRFSNMLQITSSIVMALVTGSLFYNMPHDSTSVFPRPGALFYPVLLWALNKMSETVASFMGRPILTRHKRLGFNRPAAYAVACTLTDIPFVLVTFTLFDIVFYFMVGFQHNASRFFTNWFVYLITTLCFTSLYRTIGAWCRHFGLAAQISGWITMVMMVYAGYLIPFPSMHPWFRWITYINPASYAFNAVMATEMGNLEMACVEPQYVPYGPQYGDSRYRSCASTGAAPGSDFISGAGLLDQQYHIHTGEVWRDVGILIAFWVFFSFTAAVGFEMNLASGSGSKVLFNKRSHQRQAAAADPEKTTAAALPEGGDAVPLQSTVFTFRDISYFVQHEGQELQLLRNVNGYVEPGQLVALMGSSGAGKTTLMDVLAQRKDSGRIDGSILVNGRPQGVSFQRTTGYCEQNDVHEPTTTVREALLFSARLRQDSAVPDADKVAYVEQVMELLELMPMQHALVGTSGSGLSIEQRKRLTLATELVAKPSLLFLDEPTSGLDGQSAFEICRFLRKLAAAGQTIVCTIHQPSAALFEAFDVLLLLSKGGRTTYFGQTGRASTVVLDYFSRNGAPPPFDANPAEYIVDVVQGRFDLDIDWPQVWDRSAEKTNVLATLDRLEKTEPPHGAATSEGKADAKDFAAPLGYQVRLVTQRQLVALWRNPDYVWNKIGLHVINALFGGFTFWMIGDGTFDLQLRLMAIFNFVFFAPGCINQLQPLFIRNRDLFETREKKAKAYHWFAFIAAQLISEIPVLIVCATLYFVCWYFTAGFPIQASQSGQVYLQMIFYEFLYTSIGQAIAAYSPNDYFAALANPVIIGAGLINFCGVVVPYTQIQAFWRYWMYWLDPFTYLIGGLLEPVAWNVDVQCRASELTLIPIPPAAASCGEYITDFLASHGGYVIDPANTTSCEYCAYASGAEYLRTLNINESYYGWRDVGITALFCISSYALVFLMMKLRSKATKKAG